MQNKSKLPEKQNDQNADQQNSKLNTHEELIENSPVIDQNVFDEHDLPDDLDTFPKSCVWSIIVIAAIITTVILLIP